MTEQMENLEEFRKKWCTLYNIMHCKQATIDFFEEIEELIDNDEITEETKIGSISYNITCLLEIIDTRLFDYCLLTQMIDDLNTLRKNK